jgi:hypothetical protein
MCRRRVEMEGNGARENCGRVVHLLDAFLAWTNQAIPS